jgi:type IV pilus assembly protein PilA
MIKREFAKQAGGYTLMELLLVIAALLFLLLVVVPHYLGTTHRANEAAAIKSVEDIAQAEMQYKAAYPALGYSCSLVALGGDPRSGPPSATAAQFLPREEASGKKAGYLFSLSDCVSQSAGGSKAVTSYRILAIPEIPGKSGQRGFCGDPSGAVKVDSSGGINCTQELQ